MTYRRVSDRERIRDALTAAYEVARAGLCIATVREMPRVTKAHVPAFRSAIAAMHREHSMPIDRIAHTTNRDRATIRYHLEENYGRGSAEPPPAYPCDGNRGSITYLYLPECQG